VIKRVTNYEDYDQCLVLLCDKAKFLDTPNQKESFVQGHSTVAREINMLLEEWQKGFVAYTSLFVCMYVPCLQLLSVPRSVASSSIS
jgi:hypothetical protein